MPRSPFKGRQFPPDVILRAVRWYCKYPVSYRDLAEMLEERGINVDHSTLYRWVQHFGPELEKRARKVQSWRTLDWHLDETYVRVGGRWCYLWRAIDSRGQLIDSCLTRRRDTKAAERFLRKAVRRLKLYYPLSITTDKAPNYGRAIHALRLCGTLEAVVSHRSSMYHNNLIEADHGGLKRLITPTRGFKTLASAKATIKGIECMRMIRRDHVHGKAPGPTGERRLVHQIFGLAA